jgi:RNA polymerase sigma-70 factor (ECF subfamily)
MSDHVLADALDAAMDGHAWALRVVYDDLAPRVHGYFVARGARDPEDLTSEVFLTVFPRLSKLEGGVAGLRTLVFSVAHARLVDDLRRRSRQPEATPYEPERDLRSTPSSEDEAAIGLGTQRAMALLSRLPEDQRNVVLLRHLGDLTIEEVAQALGKSPGAIKQLQRRGLLTLRDLVAREGVTP